MLRSALHFLLPLLIPGIASFSWKGSACGILVVACLAVSCLQVVPKGSACGILVVTCLSVSFLQVVPKAQSVAGQEWERLAAEGAGLGALHSHTHTYMGAVLPHISP